MRLDEAALKQLDLGPDTFIGSLGRVAGTPEELLRFMQGSYSGDSFFLQDDRRNMVDIVRQLTMSLENIHAKQSRCSGDDRQRCP